MRVLLEQTLQGLPDDASLEQAMERLLLLAKIVSRIKRCVPASICEDHSLVETVC
jgi:hypothetical protein